MQRRTRRTPRWPGTHLMCRSASCDTAPLRDSRTSDDL
jgi:hypothetical protein